MAEKKDQQFDTHPRGSRRNSTNRKYELLLETPKGGKSTERRKKTGEILFYDRVGGSSRFLETVNSFGQKGLQLHKIKTRSAGGRHLRKRRQGCRLQREGTARATGKKQDPDTGITNEGLQHPWIRKASHLQNESSGESNLLQKKKEEKNSGKPADMSTKRSKAGREHDEGYSRENGS